MGIFLLLYLSIKFIMSKVLVLGGTGFIGRHVCAKLKEAGNTVRVADKVPPGMAKLSPEHVTLFEGIDFVQANLTNATHAAKAFADGPWEVVINLAGETKLGAPDAVYEESIVAIAKSATEAAKTAGGVKRWIELSTAQVYDAGKKASDEGAKCKPWTGVAKARLAAEEIVKASSLPFTILRAPFVYGPGDTTSITPRFICASTYVGGRAGKEMMFLWGPDLAINVVHVEDVAGAVQHIATTDATAGETYNIVDKTELTQGKLAKLLETLFGIKTDFMGGLKSKAATAVSMKTVAEVANEKHMQPWADLNKEKGTSSNLSPFLDPELLYNNSLSVNGSKLLETGFDLKHPELTIDECKAAIKYFVDLKQFPDGVVQ